MMSSIKSFFICLLLLSAALAVREDNFVSKKKGLSKLFEPITCGICKATMGGLSYGLLSETSIKVFETAVYYGCQVIFSKGQCRRVTDAYVGMLMREFRLKTFDASYFCQVQVPACDNKHNKYTVLEVEDYEKEILADKPDFIKDNNFINGLYDEINADIAAGKERETILMYHLSDLHWNINYTEGANNNCGEVVCCSPNKKPPTKESEKAGKWGDYKCDANPKIAGQLKYSFNKTGNPDFIVWTGDNPDHEVYKDPTISTKATVMITEMINAHSKNTTIFPIHGNHEFDPMNIQDFNVKDDPVIQIVSSAWKHWMTPEANAEYAEQTFYSMLAADHPDTTEEFRSKMGKTRIIGYNSNDCYVFNFMLVGQYNDPGQQFDWLENLLRQMEKDGEIAIFIGHMSSGTSDCLSEVSSRLRAIFDRYQHIIRLNLFGHTHNEEIEVIRSVGDSKPIGVNHVVSSMTTHTDQNPSFRAITLDAATMLPVKIETHTLNIDDANKDDKDAIFKFHHEVSEEYGMKDLSPGETLSMTQRMESDETLATKYLKNMFASGPGYDESKGCNKNCRRLRSCMTSNSVYGEARK